VTSTTSFKLLQSRGSFNHLFPDAFLSNHMYYFTTAGHLNLLRVKDGGVVEQRRLLSLGMVSDTDDPMDESAGDLHEFPSLAFAGPDWLVVSDGRGRLLLVEIAKDRSMCRVEFEFHHQAFDTSGYVVTSALRNPQTGEIRCLVYGAHLDEGVADSISSSSSAQSRRSEPTHPTPRHPFLPRLCFRGFLPSSLVILMAS